MSYKLVWADYFEKDGIPNQEIWQYETGGHGFGNNEDQYYTNRLKNAFVKDVVLNIVAYEEDFENRKYTSAKLTTYQKKSIKYGKIVVKAKVPKGLGTWPAIWLLPNSIRENMPWPLCGEIDLMEHVGRNPYNIHFSLHTKKYNHNIGNQYTHIVSNDKIFDEFQSYEMIWEKDKIEFYLNGIKQVTFEKRGDDDFEGWPFNEEFYLILNLAIGGNWGGEIDKTIFPSVLQIASVEVFEKQSVNMSSVKKEKNIPK